MTETILDAPYAFVTYDPDTLVGKIQWRGKANEEEYKHAFLVLLEHGKKARIDNFLSDVRDQKIVSPENRKWFEKEVLPVAVNERGLKRAAVVFDGNVFKKYYLNMLIKASNKFGMPLKMFNKEEEAMKWFEKQAQ